MSKKKKNIFARIWGNFYIRHILIAALVVTIFIFGLLVVLNIITRHGQTYAVPNFTNMRPADAEELAEQSKVTLIVDDSVYIARKPRGIILEQNPKPDTRVKKWRKIFVRINAQSQQMTTVPRVVDVSLRQARALIEGRGLEVGRLSFSPDLAHGIVLVQSYRGRPLAVGAKLPVESKIDLTIGQSGTYEVEVPLLKGMSASVAKGALIEAMLNVGRILYDTSVQNITDSLNAIVYAQFPTINDGVVPLGTSVDIMLTVQPQNAKGEVGE
jgi:beta-lactam-binding protein with PASTA domain